MESIVPLNINTHKSQATFVSGDPLKNMQADRTVIVCNLRAASTEKDVFLLCKKVGNVSDVKLLRDQRGISRCMAYVEFERLEDSLVALRLSGSMINNKKIVVTHSSTNKAEPKREGMTNVDGQGRPIRIYVGG